GNQRGRGLMMKALRSPFTADVLLIVDQKWRDLPGMAALAWWLEQDSISSALLPYAAWREALVTRRPSVVVLTHMNGSRNRAIAESARRMGSRNAVIQTEGRPNNLELMEYVVGRPEDVGQVDLWFTWSDAVRSYI